MNNSVPATLKTPSKQLLIFRGAILGFLIGAGISMVPICGIRRTAGLVLNEPAQVIFFAEWLIVSAITGGALLPKFVLGDPLLQSFPETVSRQKRLFKQLIMPFSGVLFLLLYFAACGLCQRLDMGVIDRSAVINQSLRYLGLLIATAGIGIQGYALISGARTKTEALGTSALHFDSGNGYMRSPVLKLRHPCFFATLVVLMGIPLVMGTWYPLFAIPGIFIVMKWITIEQERILIEKYGESYEQFQSKTRRLLPLIY